MHLALRNTITDARSVESFDLVVLATGFPDIGVGPKREAYPPLLSAVAPLLELGSGHLDVSIDYRVRFSGQPAHAAPLYLNGLCESSHGMGDSGSFSLLALRSAAIAQSLAERLADGAARPPSPFSTQQAPHAALDLASDVAR